jgi:thiol:disulfide interchange protein
MGLGMAAPYLVIGAKPSLMKFLPKPGAWMDTFKQIMGFVLIGTVLWLMVAVDQPLIMPTLVFLAGLSAACWWIGRTPGFAEPLEKLKAWGQATVLASIIGWLAFAMPQVTDPLPWRKFTLQNFANDVNSNKTVLVEFTAEWCATCKVSKAAALDRSKTKKVVEENQVVVYEVDIDHITDQERDFFTKIQPTQAVPLIAIFPAGKKYAPISFGNGYTQSQILQALQDAGPSITN